MTPGQIRPIAVGIFRNDDRILVFEGYDPTKEEVFFRPLGGAIEFGEYGHQALAREMREELGVEVENLRFLAASENLFTFDGELGHEIVLIYEGELADRAVYERERMIGHEDDGSPFKTVWKPLAFFERGEAPLYPEGLLDLLQAHKEAECATD